MDLQLSAHYSRRPDIERAFEHLAAGAQPGSSEDPIAAMRAFVDRYGDVEARGPLSAKEVLPTRIGDVPAEWIVPHQLRGADRIVLLHGGGWVAGGLESHRPMAAVLAELSGLAVLLVGYRLAPEHPFPAGLDDCRAAYAWAWNNGPSGPDPASQVFLVGDSAGGNLSRPSVSRLLRAAPPFRADWC